MEQYKKRQAEKRQTGANQDNQDEAQVEKAAIDAELLRAKRELEEVRNQTKQLK